MNVKLKSISQSSPLIMYYDLTDYFCSETTCTITIDDMFYDHSHISFPGSRKLAERVLKKEQLPQFIKHVMYMNKNFWRT